MLKSVYNTGLNAGGTPGNMFGPIPPISTDNAITRWDGPGGRNLQNSTVILDDDGNITDLNSLSLTPIASNPGGANTIWVNSSDGDKVYYDNSPIGGDVFGPNSSVDNTLTLFDGTTGKLIKNNSAVLSQNYVQSQLGQTEKFQIKSSDPLILRTETDNVGFLQMNADLSDSGAVSAIFQTTQNKAQGGGIVIYGDAGPTGPSGEMHISTIHDNVNGVERDLVFFLGVEYPPMGVDDIPIGSGGVEVVRANSTSFEVRDVFKANLTGNYVLEVNNGVQLRPISTNPGDPHTLWVDMSDNQLYYNNTAISTGGDVVGPTPASSTDNAIVRWDGTTGKIIQNSGVILDDLQNITNVNSMTVDTITENTLNNGVNIELTNIKDGRINLPNTTNADNGVISFSNEHYIHNYGPTNTNLFIGKESGNFTNTGSRNTTLGQDTLFQLTTGNDNVAIGESSQLFNETGVRNVTVGNSTNFNNIAGNNNTAIGHLALESNEGSSNIAIGNGAGASFSTGNNNIAISNNGAAGVSNKIYIGNSSHNDTKIFGINGITPPGVKQMVIIDNNNQLGTQAIPIATGDVVGPASASDNAIARFDTTTGKLIQNSTVLISDTGNFSGVNSIDLNTVAANPGDASTLWINSADNLLYLGATVASGGSGDVVGPASATDNAIARYNGTTGKLIQDTTGFTCDDNFNVKIGNSTALLNRTLHLQSRQDMSIFIEGDTDNINDADTPQILMTMDGNASYGSMGMIDTTLPAGGDNALIFQTSSTNIGFSEGIIFRTGGIHVATPTGTPVTSFVTNPIDAMKIKPDDRKVITYAGIQTNLIEERTAANGVTIDSVNLKDGSINLTTTAANPGGANTVWQRTSDGKLFRGSVDLELQGDFVGPASSVDNLPVLFNGTSGKLGKSVFPYPLTAFSTSGLSISQIQATANSTFVGSNAGNAGSVSNICIGSNSGFNNNGTGNVFCGVLAGSPLALSNSERNVSVGTGAGRGNLNTSSRNIAIGYDCQSGNVLNNNTITIGTNINPSTDNSFRVGSEIPLTSCFIEGINGVTPPGTKQMMIIDSSNQLGSQPLPQYGYGGLYMENNVTLVDITATSTDFSNRVVIAGFTGVQPAAANIINNAPAGTITVSVSGDYLVSYALSYSSVGSNNTYSTAVYVNGTTKLPSRVSRRIQNAGDVGSICGCINCSLTAGQNVSLYIQNETNTDDVLIQDGTFGLVKIA